MPARVRKAVAPEYPLHLEPGFVRGHWGMGTVCTAPGTCKFQAAVGRLCKGNVSAVMGIRHRAALNRVRTLQQDSGSDIGQPRTRLGVCPDILLF